MRRSPPFTAPVRVAAVSLSMLVLLAAPASANHVVGPACTSVRRDLIAANTALKNANETFIQARDLVTLARSNMALAREQLQTPLVNYVLALEDEIGVGPARTGFETSLSVFVNAVALYVERLNGLPILEATRDLAAQTVLLLEKTRQGLEARAPCPAVPLDLVLLPL